MSTTKNVSLVNNTSNINSNLQEIEQSNIDLSDQPLDKRAKLLLKCSLKEAKSREEQNVLNIFEIDPNKSYFDEDLNRWVLKVNEQFAVKAFSRPAADIIKNNPEDIRPPYILSQTVNYILNEIIDIDKIKTEKYFRYNDIEITFNDICLFAEDRFRAIRQDFIILGLKGNKDCILVHEKIARFLILSLNECLDYPAFSGSQGLIKLLFKQLNTTLTSLRDFYEYVQNNSTDPNNYVSPNQQEFYAYSILLSISETHDLISLLNKIPEELKETQQIKTARRIVRAILSKEYLEFFKLLKKADILTACIMGINLKDLRLVAINQISKNPLTKNKESIYKTTLSKFSDMLLFENTDECLNFLIYAGVDVQESLIFYEHDQFEMVKANPLGDESYLKKRTNKKFIDSKRQDRLRKEIIMYY